MRETENTLREMTFPKIYRPWGDETIDKFAQHVSRVVSHEVDIYQYLKNAL